MFDIKLINKYLDENKDEFIEHPRRLEKEIKEEGSFLFNNLKAIE